MYIYISSRVVIHERSFVRRSLSLWTVTEKVDMLSTVATMAVTFVSVKESGESWNQTSNIGVRVQDLNVISYTSYTKMKTQALKRTLLRGQFEWFSFKSRGNGWRFLCRVMLCCPLWRPTWPKIRLTLKLYLKFEGKTPFSLPFTVRKSAP